MIAHDRYGEHLPRPAGAACGRDPARGQGPVRHRRARDDLRLRDLRRPRSDRRPRRQCSCSRTRATRTSARRTCTSSRTARRPRTRTSATCRTRASPAGSRAARAAARLPRSQPASRRRRSAPTRPARSGFPPPAAASSGTSRPTVSSRSTAAGRWRRASTPQARSPGTSRAAGGCSRCSRPGSSRSSSSRSSSSRSASPGRSSPTRRCVSGSRPQSAASHAAAPSSCRSCPPTPTPSSCARSPTSTASSTPRTPISTGRTCGSSWRRCFAVRDRDVEQAERLRRLYREQVEEALDGLDLVLTPTLPIVPPPLRRGAAAGDLDVREALIRFTYPFSSLGWPALALPCGETEGLPVSLQIAGRAGADALVLAAAGCSRPFEGEPDLKLPGRCTISDAFGRLVFCSALSALARLTGVGAGARSTAAPAAPQGLRAFLLRPSEAVTHEFERTPSFSVAARPRRHPLRVRALARHADASTEARRRSGRTRKLKTPAESRVHPGRALPWMTGNPYARLRARPRDHAQRASARGARSFGFNIRWCERPAADLTDRIPGMSRWSVGRRRDELSGLVLGDRKIVGMTTRTPSTIASSTRSTSRPRSHGLGQLARPCRAQPLRQDPVRACRRQRTARGARSTRRANPALARRRRRAVARRGRHDGRATPRRRSLHELTPGFAFGGDTALRCNGGTPADLYRVYVFSDSDCVNVIHRGSIVGIAGLCPAHDRVAEAAADDHGRDHGSSAYLEDLQGANRAAAVHVRLGEGHEHGERPGAGEAGGDARSRDRAIALPARRPRTTRRTRRPKRPVAARDPESTGAPVDLWDSGWPNGRFYWTVVPVRFETADAEADDASRPRARPARAASASPDVTGFGGDTAPPDRHRLRRRRPSRSSPSTPPPTRSRRRRRRPTRTAPARTSRT